MPQITLPTRLSDTCDTLIDNIFTNNFEKDHDNYVLTSKITDHQMTFCSLINSNYKKCKSKLYIEVETINDHKLECFKADIININVHF